MDDDMKAFRAESAQMPAHITAEVLRIIEPVNVQIAEPPKELRHIDVLDDVFKSTINICGIKYRTLFRWGDPTVFTPRVRKPCWMDLYVAAKKNGIKVDVQAWSMADLWKALTSL